MKFSYPWFERQLNKFSERTYHNQKLWFFINDNVLFKTFIGEEISLITILSFLAGINNLKYACLSFLKILSF